MAPGPRTVAPIALATGLMAMGTVQSVPMVAVSAFARDPIGLPAVLGMLALGCLGSGIADVLSIRVIALADATTSSTVTYLTPLVAGAAIAQGMIGTGQRSVIRGQRRRCPRMCRP